MSRGEPVSIEQAVALLLGSGVLGSAVAWLTTRHRPKVDTAQVVLAGSNDLINQLQEERDRLDQRIDAVEKRATSAEQRATEAEDRAKESERLVTYATAKVAEIRDHHLDTVHGFFAGTIPPLRPIPRDLQDVLTEADYPAFPVNAPDTGVPGVDPNPPQE